MTVAYRPVADPVEPGFADVLTSELTKLRTTRATYVEVALAIIIALAMTALISVAIGSTFDEWSSDDVASWEPVFVGFFGITFGGIVLMILGVTVVSSEYTSGMMRLTFTTTPRRGRLLAAKLAAITIVSLGAGAVIVFGTFAVGQWILGLYGTPTDSITEGETLRVLIASWALTPLYPVIGACIAAVARSTAPALTAVLTLFFAPLIFGPLFPSSWQENVLRWLPGNVADHLMMPDPDTDALLYIDPAVAFVALCLWLAAFLGIAYLSTIRRDV
jgi:ABC-2 type transport system permease protein